MEDAEIEGATLESRCERCGRWIDWPVARVADHVYCCEACAIGEACDCPDLTGSPDERRVLEREWISLARR